MKRSGKEILLVSALMVILGLVFTYPLIHHFNTGIPFSKISGGTISFDKPGDHLQIFYWFWLLKDNLFGGSTFFTNPYEFNMIGKQMGQHYSMFPMSLIYVLLTPFGDIFAYNGTIIAAYVLTGLFMYLFGMFFTGSRTAAFFSALIFTLAPFRHGQLTGGHLNGFIFFLYPLILYLFEVSLTKGRLRYSILCGICIFSLALMELHLIYYLFLFLSIYIPFRLFFFVKHDEVETPFYPTVGRSPGRSFKRPVWRPFWLDRFQGAAVFLQLGAAITLVVFAQMVLCYVNKTPFLSTDFLLALIIYSFVGVIFGIFVSSLYPLVTSLTFKEAYTVDAISNLPIYGLLVFAVQFFFFIPHLIKILIVCVFGAIGFLKIYFLIKFRNFTKGGFFEQFHPNLKRILFILSPILFFMIVSAGFLMFRKMALLSGATVEGGRAISEVKLYSPELKHVFQKFNTAVERNIYIGLIPAIVGLFTMIRLIAQLFQKKPSIQKQDMAIISFFSLVFALSYLVVLGFSFGDLSLYTLLYNYFPFFHYQRVPPRIIILSFLALSILSAYFIRYFQIRGILRSRLFYTMSTFLAIGVLIDYHNLQPVAITALSGKKEIYKHIKSVDNDTVLLEIPLWSGDNSNSSLYEYFATLDQLKRINGYSPVVSQEYLDTVYAPLSSLNFGEMGKEQYHLLKKIGVKYLTVHDNAVIFPSISPLWDHRAFWTVRRLMNSSMIEYIKKDTHRDIYLFKLKEDISNSFDNTDRSKNYYHIPIFMDAVKLPRLTGKNYFDSQIQKEVVWAGVHKDHENYLTYGPYNYFTKGDYIVYFRLKAAANGLSDPVARIEVSNPVLNKGKIASQSILSQRDIRGTDFPETETYHDFYLSISLPEKQRLEFRTWFYRKTDIWIEKIVLATSDSTELQKGFEAEWLMGDIGEVKTDPAASEGKALFADVGMYSPNYLFYGPYRRFPAGKYRVSYRLKIDASSASENDDILDGIAQMDIASDMNRNILAARLVDWEDFKSKGYIWIPLDFILNQDNDLSFRLMYNKKVNLWADRIEITPME